MMSGKGGGGGRSSVFSGVGSLLGAASLLAGGSLLGVGLVTLGAGTSFQPEGAAGFGAGPLKDGASSVGGCRSAGVFVFGAGIFSAGILGVVSTPFSVL